MSSRPRKFKKSNDEIGNTSNVVLLSEEIVETLELIGECQNEMNSLSEKANEEILQIEEKYNNLRKPCYEKRGELIKKIPNFWMTAFINHPRLSTILDEREKECLYFWTEFEVEEDDESSCRIRFHFKENPYFENKVLTKEFQLGTRGGKFTCSYGPLSINSPIQWKEGMNLLKQLSEPFTKKKENQNSKYIGFFNWFTDDSDEPVIEIAGEFKNDLWLNPLKYYPVPVTEFELENDEHNNVIHMET